MARIFFILGLVGMLWVRGTHAWAGEPGPVLRTPSVFSYQAPSGWSSQVAGGYALGGFSQAVGPESNNFTPDITFITSGYASLDGFVKGYKPRLIDMTPRVFTLKLVDAEPFVTAAGMKGMRLHSIDPASPPIAEQFAYVFNNRDGLVCEFACACAPADAGRLLPVFEASMKSVRLL